MNKKTKAEAWEILDKAALKSSPSYGEYAFIVGQSSKMYTLAKLGEWMDPKAFSKYPKIYFKPTFNSSIYDNFRTHIRGLKENDWGESYVKKALKFTELWEKVFLTDKHPEFWSYILALYEEFYPKDEMDELERISRHAIPIYDRSMHLAGLTFYFAIKNGIYSGEMLKEIFLVSLFMNSGLAQPSFHFNLYTALELDRTGKESGAAFLKRSGHTEEAIHFYINNPEASFTICKEKLSKHVSNDRLFDLIKIQHEASQYAYPKGLTKYECDDIELMIIIVNQSFPFEATSAINMTEIVETIRTSRNSLHHWRVG